MLGSRPARGRVALAAVLALVGITAACSSGTPRAVHTIAARPTGPTLLSFSVFGPPQVITAYAKIAADYTALHPKTVVNVRPFDSAAAADTELDRQLAAGTPPDIFLAPLEALPDLIQRQAVRRVDELLGARNVDFGDGFQRYALEAFSANNALQCMPVDVSPMVVYYNADLVNLARLSGPNQPPVNAANGWTLAQFALAARRASRAGVNGVYVAPTLEQLAPFIFSGGGGLVDNVQTPTTLTLADGSTTSSLEKLLETLRAPALTLDPEELAQSSALQRFKTGNLAMMLGYRDLTPQLRNQENLHFDVMPMPRIGGRATVGKGSGLCVSAGSEHVRKTADFLAYAVSDPASAVLAQTGYTVPVNLDVAHSDAYLQAGQRPLQPTVFEQNVGSIRPLPTGDAWSAVEAAASPLLTRLFYDVVIDPLDERLRAIDNASIPLLVQPTPSATPAPTGGSQ